MKPIVPAARTFRVLKTHSNYSSVRDVPWISVPLVYKIRRRDTEAVFHFRSRCLHDTRRKCGWKQFWPEFLKSCQVPVLSHGSSPPRRPSHARHTIVNRLIINPCPASTGRSTPILLKRDEYEAYTTLFYCKYLQSICQVWHLILYTGCDSHTHTHTVTHKIKISTF